MLCSSVLETIGRTPLVRLNRVGAHLQCNLYAKCEFFNPGGSVKDRIGYRMVHDAERCGRIKPGDTLIEPTSGNTGIGIALAGAVRGYRVIITMPEKMSREKQVVLEALGAEIIRTPTEAAWDNPESHIMVARRLQSELPNAHILDQYSNPSNPLAHYETTAQEILDDLHGNVHMVVAGAGTGGTISGLGKRLKEANPKVRVVGADPVGSILGGGKEVHSYKVEGIGYDFVPEVLHSQYIDEWVKTTDRPSFQLARCLIREEGLLCGGSSGSVLYAALKAAPGLKPGDNCVIVLADGVRNYMSKFVDDKWMLDNGFLGADIEGNVEDILRIRGNEAYPIITLGVRATARSAIKLMRDKGISQIPVVDQGVLVGVITENAILEHLSAGGSESATGLGTIMDRSVPSVEASTPLDRLQRIIMHTGCAVVVDERRRPMHILTKIDLLDWLSGVMDSAPNRGA